MIAHPAAFEDDVCDWTVTLQERPERPRWQPAHKRKEPATVVVTVTQQIDPLSAAFAAKKENRAYSTWLVLFARRVPYVEPIPTCVCCDKASVLGPDGLCRACRPKNVITQQAEQGPLFLACVDCFKEIKGINGATRCPVCASRAVKEGTAVAKTFHVHCRQCHARLGAYNTSGYCRKHGYGKRAVSAVA